MRRFQMKLVAPALGSLALILVAACEQRNDTMTTPESVNAPGMTEQDKNALRPAPTVPSPGMGGASSLSAEDTQPVSGIDTEPMGTGHGGHAGHAGHAGKKGH